LKLAPGAKWCSVGDFPQGTIVHIHSGRIWSMAHQGQMGWSRPDVGSKPYNQMKANVLSLDLMLDPYFLTIRRLMGWAST